MIKQVKYFTISLFLFPLFLGGTITSANSESNLLISQKKTDKEFDPASLEDTFLYRQMAVNFLCRARMAEIEFPKAIGIAAATFSDVIAQKHGGFVEEVPDKKLSAKQLYMSAELQLVEGSLKFCPKSVPEEAKNKFNEFLKTKKKNK